MDNFFAETYLTIEDESGESFELRMRPLKVKELPQFMRISAQAGETDKELETLPGLIGLIKQTVDGDITGLPLDVLDGIIDAFMEINFKNGATAPGGAKKKSDKIDIASELAIAFDFLICQGHAFNEIMEYTLPQFRIFQQTACDRLTGKKKQEKNPIDVFRKMGIPIKNN